MLQEAQKLLPPEFPLSDAWDQSQDTLTNQDFSQDSAQVEQDNFLVQSTTSKRTLRVFEQGDQDESTTLDDRPWKKIKSDTDLKELLNDEPISSMTCTKFYSTLEDYYEKKNFTDEDALKNANSESDSESASEKTGTSKSHIVKDQQEDKKPLDDRPWDKEEGKRSNNESSEYTEDSKITERECVEVRSLSFHSEYTEHTVKNFTFIEETHERQLTRLSYENSPKSLGSPRKSITLSSGESPTTSYESSRATEEIYISEDCHVVPRIDCLRDDSTLEGNLDPSKTSDKLELKPRHASIDSVMDSALGDSCSSSDCQKDKNDIDINDESKRFDKLDNSSWQPIDRESLASRLPGEN